MLVGLRSRILVQDTWCHSFLEFLFLDFQFGLKEVFIDFLHYLEEEVGILQKMVAQSDSILLSNLDDPQIINNFLLDCLHFLGYCGPVAIIIIRRLLV